MQQKSDFWWLAPKEVTKYKFLEVWHQEPYSDEPKSNKQPYPGSCFSSLDGNGNLSTVCKRYPLDFIANWRDKCFNINIFKSLSLFSDEEDREVLLGPFVIDIDREEGDWDKGYTQNLNDALEATRKLLKEYLHHL